MNRFRNPASELWYRWWFLSWCTRFGHTAHGERSEFFPTVQARSHRKNAFSTDDHRCAFVCFKMSRCGVVLTFVRLLRCGEVRCVFFSFLGWGEVRIAFSYNCTVRCDAVLFEANPYGLRCGNSYGLRCGAVVLLEAKSYGAVRLG